MYLICVDQRDKIIGRQAFSYSTNCAIFIRFLSYSSVVKQQIMKEYSLEREFQARQQWY